MSKGFQFLVLLLTVLLELGRHAEAAQVASNIRLTVDKPERNGITVGREMVVEGTASLPAGHHIWAFARREGFEPTWWTQGEAKLMDDGRWEVAVHFGEPRDKDCKFELAVAVFEKEAHTELKKHHDEATTTGVHNPIIMPEVAASPIVLQVMKNSHK